MTPAWTINFGPVPASQFDEAADRAAAPVLDVSDTSTREQVVTALAAAAAVVETGVMGDERVACTVTGTAMPQHRRADAPQPAALTITLAFVDSVDNAERSAQLSELGIAPTVPERKSEVWEL